jgi:hypothetical protein
MCFTTDRLLVIPGQGQGQAQPVVSLGVSSLQKLYLVEGGAGRDYALALDASGAGGVSVLAVRRLQDLVRVVNALVKQGITLGYHAHAALPIG